MAVNGMWKECQHSPGMGGQWCLRVSWRASGDEFCIEVIWKSWSTESVWNEGPGEFILCLVKEGIGRGFAITWMWNTRAQFSRS